MTPKEFFDAVAEMRRLQKLYLKTRNTILLKASKKQEKIVDDEIERVATVNTVQQIKLKL